MNEFIFFILIDLSLLRVNLISLLYAALTVILIQLIIPFALLSFLLSLDDIMVELRSQIFGIEDGSIYKWSFVHC